MDIPVKEMRHVVKGRFRCRQTAHGVVSTYLVKSGWSKKRANEVVSFDHGDHRRGVTCSKSRWKNRQISEAVHGL